MLTVEKLPSPMTLPKMKSFGVLLAGGCAGGGAPLRCCCSTRGKGGIVATGKAAGTLCNK